MPLSPLGLRASRTWNVITILLGGLVDDGAGAVEERAGGGAHAEPRPIGVIVAESPLVQAREQGVGVGTYEQQHALQPAARRAAAAHRDVLRLRSADHARRVAAGEERRGGRARA